MRRRTFNRVAALVALAFVGALVGFVVITHWSPAEQRLSALAGVVRKVPDCSDGGQISGAMADQFGSTTGRVSLHFLSCGPTPGAGPGVVVATFRTPADTRRAMISLAVEAAASTANSLRPAFAQCQTPTEMFVLELRPVNGVAPNAPAVASAMNRRFCLLAGASAPVVPQPTQ